MLVAEIFWDLCTPYKNYEIVLDAKYIMQYYICKYDNLSKLSYWAITKYFIYKATYMFKSTVYPLYSLYCLNFNNSHTITLHPHYVQL